MQFRRVSANKYIGEYGYSLIQCRNGEFAICKNGTVTGWGTGFQTVRSAENFINQRDYVNASTDKLPIEESDLDFIEMIYGASYTPNGRQLKTNTFTLTIPKDFKQTHTVRLKANAKGTPDQLLDDVEKLLVELDELSEPVVSSVTYRGTELREIIAKSDRRRTARDIVKDLVRVRSSNVWAYGIEIKDNKAKVGDVYIQFKAKNGGPGDIYRYYEVPINVWRKLLSSQSKGHGVWVLLRNNFYYPKLTGDRKGKLPNAIN